MVVKITYVVNLSAIYSLLLFHSSHHFLNALPPTSQACHRSQTCSRASRKSHQYRKTLICFGFEYRLYLQLIIHFCPKYLLFQPLFLIKLPSSLHLTWPMSMPVIQLVIVFCCLGNQLIVCLRCLAEVQMLFGRIFCRRPRRPRIDLEC